MKKHPLPKTKKGLFELKNETSIKADYYRELRMIIKERGLQAGGFDVKDYAIHSIIDRLSKSIKECNDLSRRAENALDKLNGVERRNK